jgi:hypothetical protein
MNLGKSARFRVRTNQISKTSGRSDASALAPIRARVSTDHPAAGAHHPRTEGRHWYLIWPSIDRKHGPMVTDQAAHRARAHAGWRACCRASSAGRGIGSRACAEPSTTKISCQRARPEMLTCDSCPFSKHFCQFRAAADHLNVCAALRQKQRRVLRRLAVLAHAVHRLPTFVATGHSVGALA